MRHRQGGHLLVASARAVRVQYAREKVRQRQRGDARAMDLRACACDVPCVACEERRLSPHVLEIVRHGCTCNVQCRRYRRTERFGVPRSFHKWTKRRFRWKKGGRTIAERREDNATMSWRWVGVLLPFTDHRSPIWGGGPARVNVICPEGWGPGPCALR